MIRNIIIYVSGTHGYETYWLKELASKPMETQLYA